MTRVLYNCTGIFHLFEGGGQGGRRRLGAGLLLVRSCCCAPKSVDKASLLSPCAMQVHARHGTPGIRRASCSDGEGEQTSSHTSCTPPYFHELYNATIWPCHKEYYMGFRMRHEGPCSEGHIGFTIGTLNTIDCCTWTGKRCCIGRQCWARGGGASESRAQMLDLSLLTFTTSREG